MDCEWSHTGRCVQALDSDRELVCGDCPFTTFEEKVSCDMFAPHDCGTVTSAMEKRASWRNVAEKGSAIFASGGVDIVSENTREVEAYVMDTDTVIQNFPVSDGGPYDVILSKKSWGNEENVGGWVQGYLCDCTWGSYHSGDGSGGGKWSGRFCSHAYATLLAANMRARQEFMNDRRAGRMAKILGECAECGEIRDISPRSGLCRDCQDRLTFNAFVTAGWNSDKTASEDAIEFMDENASEEDVDRISDEIERVQIDGHTALLRWNGYRAIVNTEDPDTRQASRKDATRHFTYAEMLELDEEIDDKPLHNKNRLRDYPKEL